MAQTVKVGPKGRHITIPDGWVVVTSGVCKKGDKFVNCSSWKWSETEEEDWGDEFDFFECLIRNTKND